MAKVHYITNMSLDGYIEDDAGDFSWINPEQVFDFITDLLRPVGTYLYGRRLLETMAGWDSPVDDFPLERREFARVWQQHQKIVFSRTLTGAPTQNTRVEQNFDAEAMRKLKRDSKHDLGIGGAELAARALEAGLIDECHLFVNPVIVGAGKPALRTGSQRNLDLLETRRFDTGVVYLRYAVSQAPQP
jgi:dihydrofolate reductase